MCELWSHHYFLGSLTLSFLVAVCLSKTPLLWLCHIGNFYRTPLAPCTLPTGPISFFWKLESLKPLPVFSNWCFLTIVKHLDWQDASSSMSQNNCTDHDELWRDMLSAYMCVMFLIYLENSQGISQTDANLTLKVISSDWVKLGMTKIHYIPEQKCQRIKKNIKNIS